jgi:nucleoside-diphosphate-sugar epimerase
LAPSQPIALTGVAGRVLVTGAGGFVGRALCPALVRAGWQVRAAVRKAGTLPDVEMSVVGEINDRTDWSPVLAGVDCVVHLANLAHVLGGLPSEAYESTNVRGTGTLVAACRRANVRRIVYLSSLKAMGERSAEGSESLDEQTPCAPQDPYGVSKLRAEALVLAESSVEGVVIRPPLVYGPGVRANFLRLLRAVDRRVPLPLALVDNRRAMIYRENLVHAIELCLRHPEAAREVWLVRDGRELATRELVARLARLMERPALLLPVPPRAMRWAGRLTGRSADVERLVSSFSVSSHKIQSRLGWSPPFDEDQGLAATVAWYRLHSSHPPHPASGLPASSRPRL